MRTWRVSERSSPEFFLHEGLADAEAETGLPVRSPASSDSGRSATVRAGFVGAPARLARSSPHPCRTWTRSSAPWSRSGASRDTRPAARSGGCIPSWEYNGSRTTRRPHRVFPPPEDDDPGIPGNAWVDPGLPGKCPGGNWKGKEGKGEARARAKTAPVRFASGDCQPRRRLGSALSSSPGNGPGGASRLAGPAAPVRPRRRRHADAGLDEEPRDAPSMP